MISSDDAEPPLIVVEDNKLPMDEEKRNLMDKDTTLEEEEGSNLMDEGHKNTEDNHIADRPADDTSFYNTSQTIEEGHKEYLPNDDKITGKGTVFQGRIFFQKFDLFNLSYSRISY